MPRLPVTAWDKDKLIGFARFLTDFVFNGQINNVVVDKEYKGMGIGKHLINFIKKYGGKSEYKYQ